LEVPAVRGTVLALSSVLLGLQGKSLPWVSSPEDTVWLSPQNTFAATDTLAVFAEGYGLAPGTSYTLHVGLTRQRSALVRLLKGKRESVALTEHLSFPEATGQIRRAISLQGLEPGKYELVVRLEGGGKEVLRRRTMVIGEASSLK